MPSEQDQAASHADAVASQRADGTLTNSEADTIARQLRYEALMKTAEAQGRRLAAIDRALADDSLSDQLRLQYIRVIMRAKRL
jgi:hypothetical protein